VVINKYRGIDKRSRETRGTHFLSFIKINLVRQIRGRRNNSPNIGKANISKRAPTGGYL
jgi:phosphopantetheine adenylyltransferase